MIENICIDVQILGVIGEFLLVFAIGFMLGSICERHK